MNANNTSKKPVLTIVHTLPGRIRMRISDALPNPKQVELSIKGHEGILSVAYTPTTRSILVCFDPREVTREEMIVRVGLSLALALEARPIQIFEDAGQHDISDSAYSSGLLLLIALIHRLINRYDKRGSWIEWAAGLGTAWSVLDHGVSEVKEQGNFDPEVLSVVYLFTALVKGNFLPAAMFTWLTTFGRHLIEVPAAGIELQPVEFADERSDHLYYEVVITPVRPTSDGKMFVKLLPAIVKYATTAKGDGGRNDLIDEIQKVSALHGEVLEGLGGFRSGIPIKVR